MTTLTPSPPPKPSRPKHPPMTADEAQAFDRFSVHNAAVLVEAAATRGCRCQPYVDWFTYDRWHALGRQVRRGEKSTRLPGFVPVRQKDEATGEDRIVGKRPWVSFVFYRCQTKDEQDE